jgi:hypothetical protein
MKIKLKMKTNNWWIVFEEVKRLENEQIQIICRETLHINKYGNIRPVFHILTNRTLTRNNLHN